MKMCLATCLAGCTKEEFGVEVQRLVQFLETSGGSARSNIEEEREKASDQLDFERAATLHKEVEKLDEVLRGRPELTRRIQDLDAVILQRAVEEQTIGVYGVRGGRLADPFFLRFAEIASQPRSAEQIFREHFVAGPGATEGDLDRKSTRLNSSHGYISYAVFCLKKKHLLILLSYHQPTVSLH